MMPQSSSTRSVERRQEVTSVLSKLEKMGKQSGDKPVSGRKRSLESDESDSEDDDDDEDEDDDEEDDDEAVPMKKEQPVTKGLFLHFSASSHTHCIRCGLLPPIY